MITIIDPWAVLIATVAAYLVGWAWYSPLLWQKPWMDARGDTGENWETEGKKEMPKIMAYGFLNTLAETFAIAVLLTLVGVSSLTQALQVSLLFCFGFVVTTKFNDLLYTALPPHWGRRAQIVFLVDTGYQIALFTIVTTVIWYMH
ncbi:DUF1761 domain-containing protein [Candidatus Kaiserbacteria bacterium]|nr:DUF1761 domain-containing protein [Candidatus Kaiserbacteria bacterium]